MRYNATGKAVDELERNLKLTDGILRYLTVKADPDTPTVSPSAPRPHSDEPRRGGDEPRRAHDDESVKAEPSA
jgi:hypothetical protein